MRLFANLVSYFLHPIFLYTYLYVCYWVLFPYPLHSLQPSGIMLISAIIFANTALLPVVFLLLSKKSLVNQTQAERQRTILVVMIVYTATYFAFPKKFIPDYLQWVLLAIVLGMLVAVVVNNFFKISLHASGWGGFVAVFAYLLFSYGSSFFYPFILAVLAAGLVGFSRLYLGAHNNKELYTGYLSGFGVTLIVLSAMNHLV